MVLIEKKIAWYENYAVWFPSPCGDYGSYPVQSRFGSSLVNVSFRPLAGIMVLIFPSPFME